jgi:hypothetical protein
MFFETSKTDQQDIDAVKSFVLAVVDQFLKRHGFVSKSQEDVGNTQTSVLRESLKTARHPSARSPSESRRATSRHQVLATTQDRIASEPHNTRTEQRGTRSPSIMPPPRLVPRKRTALASVENTPSRAVTPGTDNGFEDSGLAGDDASRGRLTVESSGKRHRWIDDIVAVSPFLFPIRKTANFVGAKHRSLALFATYFPNPNYLSRSPPPSCPRS